jgi:hypothetical protein
MDGHWELPPAPGRVWVDASWVVDNGEWVFYPGHWEETAVPMYAEAPPAEISIPMGPPPPRRVEMAPRQPGYGYVWIDGDWIWNGQQYLWAPGRWEAPRPGMIWVAPRWQPFGARVRWRPGHWMRR